MSNKKLERILETGRSSFFGFCQVVTKDEDFKFANFHKFICDRIDEELKRNKDGMRECFSLPPGYGKSTILSQLLPAYLLGLYPDYLVLLISYAGSLSVDNAKKAKAIMEKPVYKLLFPETQIIGTSLKPDYHTSKGGVIRALGRGGTITGRRANFILIDDILSGPEEANSDAIIKKIQEWFPTVARSRLLPGGGICILSTRWTKKDLIGFVTENPKSRWKYVNMECLYSGREPDPIGRKVGEVLWPDFYTKDMVLETQAENPRLFEVVYQGNCVADENTLINADCIAYVDPSDVSPDTYIVMSIDTASRIEVRNDFTVFTISRVSKSLNSVVVMDIIKRKFEFPDLLEFYDDLKSLWKPDLIIVENADCGPQLAQMRKKDEIFLSTTMKQEEKFGLADMLDVKFKFGEVKFLQPLSLKTELLQELNEFPYGTHDDVILSILHFMRWYVSNDPLSIVPKRKASITQDYINKKLKKINNKRYKKKITRLPSRGLLG